MEFRNTPPAPPIPERDTSSLIEDLCIALRNVAVWDHSLPSDPRAVRFVEEVAALESELSSRHATIEPRISTLSLQTGWQMELLLRECLLFPSVIPYVREADGVRRVLRCISCRQADAPDRNGLLVCLACLKRAIQAAQQGAPLQGFLVLRSHTPSLWCAHAGPDTVLLAPDGFDAITPPTYCYECLTAELIRRQGAGA